MKLLSNFHCFFIVLIILTGIGLPLSSLFAEETPQLQEDKATKPEEQEATLIDIYSWATILPKELIDLQSKMTKENNFKVVEKELAVLTEEANAFNRNVTLAQSNSDVPLFQVRQDINQIYKITSKLNKLSAPITATISELSVKKKEWQRKKDRIAEYDQKQMLTLTLGKEQQGLLSDTIDNALELIDTELKKVLTVGHKIGDLQVLLYSIDVKLMEIDKRLRKFSTKQTSLSIFSSEFYTRLNVDLFRVSIANIRQVVSELMATFTKDLNIILLSLGAWFLFCLGIYRTKHLVTPSSYWYAFARHPLATTVFVASSLNVIFSMLPVKLDLPQQWESFLRILNLLAAIRLTAGLVENNIRRRLLKSLIIFMAVAQIMLSLNLPQELIRLYVVCVSIFALGYYFYQLPSARRKTGFEGWINRSMGIFPAAVLLFGFSGFDLFALIIFATLLLTIVAGLLVWILYLLTLGFLDLLLSIQPSKFLKEQRQIILKNLKPMLAGLHFILLIAIEGVIWDFFPNVSEAIVDIFVEGFDLLSLHVAPGFFIAIIFIIYGALLTSKAIQLLLLTKVLPSFVSGKGAQLSITRLVHYGVLTIGFIIMLKVLGFESNQLAILGGALGVGIGFGLQAIVNNFVSGLILLFERPIKVGDTIQVGTEYGEVKNLGLRATIIQTFDNAEIVVPNSDLISTQVTNWTLAERKVRLRIPVGVAYGTDVAKVLEILRACGNVNPMVLSTPAPIAFFLAFGASSLDFELRVWIPDFLERTQVLSDLNQDIESELSLNNIEIPFPQSDLHLRSVDETAAARIRGTSVTTQPGLADSVSGVR